MSSLALNRISKRPANNIKAVTATSRPPLINRLLSKSLVEFIKLVAIDLPESISALRQSGADKILPSCFRADLYETDCREVVERMLL